jgi:hypothetical protein
MDAEREYDRLHQALDLLLLAYQDAEFNADLKTAIWRDQVRRLLTELGRLDRPKDAA